MYESDSNAICNDDDDGSMSGDVWRRGGGCSNGVVLCDLEAGPFRSRYLSASLPRGCSEGEGCLPKCCTVWPSSYNPNMA